MTTIVTHLGKFYPPVRGGMERVLEALARGERARGVDSRALVVGTARHTVRETVDGVPVTRAASLLRVGSVWFAPALIPLLRRVETELKGLLSLRPHTDYRIRTLINRAPVSCPTDSPVAAAAARAVRSVTGREVTPGGVPYFTEACVFVPVLGLPMVICGPGDPRLAHQPDEFVELEQLNQAARVYVEIIRELLVR